MLLLLTIMVNTVIDLLCIAEFQPVKVVAQGAPSMTSPRWTECPLPESTIDAVFQQCTKEVSGALWAR